MRRKGPFFFVRASVGSVTAVFEGGGFEAGGFELGDDHALEAL
ncbi:hypothetical protein FBZ85_12546, partial [Azospirillum brasilense]